MKFHKLKFYQQIDLFKGNFTDVENLFLGHFLMISSVWCFTSLIYIFRNAKTSFYLFVKTSLAALLFIPWKVCCKSWAAFLWQYLCDTSPGSSSFLEHLVNSWYTSSSTGIWSPEHLYLKDIKNTKYFVFQNKYWFVVEQWKNAWRHKKELLELIRKKPKKIPIQKNILFSSFFPQAQAILFYFLNVFFL